MKAKWLGVGLLLFAALSLTACGSGGGGSTAPAAQAPGAVTLQGNLVGTAAPVASLAAATVPLAGDVAVVVVDETGTQAASQVVSAGGGQFSLAVPEGHQYVIVFRQGTNQGKTLGVLAPDATGKTTISLPAGSSDVNLGDIVIDPKKGTATCLTEVNVAHPDQDLPDTDSDGVPDVCDNSDDEDGDGVLDSADDLAFDATESLDTDGDGIPDNVDPDDDNDGVPDASDAFPTNPSEWADTDGDGIGDNADADDDNDGIADALDAFPKNPVEAIDTDGDGIGDNLDLDDDNDGVADASDAFPKNPFEWADTDGDGIGNNVDLDDDNDGLADGVDPFPLVAGSTSPVLPPAAMDPLNQIAVVQPGTLAQYVKNNVAAIRLGKAFFWDMQVGSDGIMACATCHFSAGADSRKKNQINPGLNDGDMTFGFSVGATPPGWGPNYTLTPADFPLHQRGEPADLQSSPILRDTNDVVGSQGVRLSLFVDVVPGSAVDLTSPIPDPVFNVGGVNTRRVEPRNTPTVINTVFNFTNFWDGRGHFLFNGENAFGPADPDAGVWFNVGGIPVKRPVEIQFASLASVATMPAVDEFEMSARGRTFPKIGRKMLSLIPLGKQLVHPGDSVLGPLSKATILANGTISGAKGLNTTYGQMIRDSFRNELWDSAQLTPDGFTQMEANFSLYWGLAVQLYLSTLVSDQTPFDLWLGGDLTALTDQEKLGFVLFSGIGNCAVCHGGTELSNNSYTVAAFNSNVDQALIDVMFVADGSQAIYDDGFNNTAVRPTTEDIGRGGTAPFINPMTGNPYPLAFTSLSILQQQGLVPFEVPFFPDNLYDNKDGLFKVPGLRNVALTAPYFHNGSVMNLEEVVDFYIRGGNFPVENFHDLDPIIGEGNSLLQGKDIMHAALVAFLGALTDQRVIAQSAPFDHPELFIPEGDPEVLIKIPATGADGQVALP